MNIKGLTHIEVLTIPSCPHGQAAVNMVRKVADSLLCVIATKTLVATPEIVRLFNLQEGKTYDWENINGFPAIRERR